MGHFKKKAFISFHWGNHFVGSFVLCFEFRLLFAKSCVEQGCLELVLRFVHYSRNHVVRKFVFLFFFMFFFFFFQFRGVSE